ncbi:MAG TPA: helix-turn-helix domain-containing protein [Pirellulaceae bacterium]|nr:helix-turn-helix domain-containing protein [Pirellulaceae bacterium]
MSYDYQAIAADVKAALEADPKISLLSICKDRQIDRHTINRALRGCLGVVFRELKARVQAEQIQDVLQKAKLKPIKQAASDAGYGSSSALAKHARRMLGRPPTAVRRGG